MNILLMQKIRTSTKGKPYQKNTAIKQNGKGGDKK